MYNFDFPRISNNFCNPLLLCSKPKKTASLSLLQSSYSNSEFSEIITKARQLSGESNLDKSADSSDQIIIAAIILIFRSTNRFGLMNTMKSELQLLGLSYVIGCLN